MNNAQRVILATYPVFAGLILPSEYFSSADFSAYFKIAVILALTMSVVWIDKVCPEQKVMALAFIFMAIGDFVFVVPPTFTRSLVPYGIASFAAAYMCLIAALQRNFQVGIGEVVIALPILAVLLYVAALLLPYVVLPVLIGTIIFAAILSYMTWTAICTIIRQYFRLRTSWLIALGAGLIFASDLRLAYEVFYPLLNNLVFISASYWVRGPFVAGWIFMAAAVADDQPLRTSRQAIRT